MKLRAGFTIVEIIITLTIMVILVSLSVVSLSGSLAKGRDDERKTDVNNIILFQESAYNRNNSSYFPSNSATTTLSVWYQSIDKKNLRAPGVVDPSYSLVEATNTVQTAAGVLPQPTATTYVYQPLTSSGATCTVTGACRKFNIYYLQEVTNTAQMVSSKNQ